MLKEGEIVEGPFWPEPVEVKKVENYIEYIHIVGATIYSNTHVDQLIKKDDLDKLQLIETLIDFSSPGDEIFLALEAERYRFASLFDPLLAMNTSKIDPLPFQIEAVYGYILKLPRIRFLIADDPGAGKTIMAGLIIKELKLRGIARRILVVTPGHLKDQWRRELKDKFDEKFVVIDRNFLGAHYGENPWEKESQIITSIDFIKQEDILPSLKSVAWDLVIVDESHKMAAYKYGEKLSKTERYKVGEILSENAEHLLFLTATPHKGDPENFRLFLDLLVPGFFATKKLMEESIRNKENPLFIRRIKEDLKDFDGKPIFTTRYTKTIKFRLSEKEKDLYNELSRYVIEQYNKALQKDKKRNVAFALLILQRRMASSTYALLKSLERRKRKLEELSREPEIKEEVLSFDLEEVEDYEEEERWKYERRWETLSIAENKDELKKEIETIENLVERAKKILKEEKEVKISELKKVVHSLGKEKILIFTESKDTLEYLVNKIKSWGYSVNYIHGGMNLYDRIKAESIFKNQTQVMVATEAAGEGINLQFCHLMINYDIPWNPNRLEQRMGRIHRYGQTKEVHAFNLVAEDTREGKVLSKLMDKLEEIKRAIGSDKVFDVIGDVFYGKNLYQLILEAVANTRRIDEILNEIDIKVDEKYITKIKEALGESLATRHIDYTRIKEMAEKAREYRLIPEYVEEFFKKAFKKAGGRYKELGEGFISIEHVPLELRKFAEDVNFRSSYGNILRSYPKATFDKDIAFNTPEAEFISFGHPLMEALLAWVKKNYFEKLQRGAVFVDPSGKYKGIIWFFEGEVRDGKASIAGKRLMALYEDGNKIVGINPAILWDFVAAENNDTIKLDIEGKKRKAIEHAIKSVESYKEELMEERKRQAEVKRKYGIKSLDYLISRLDADLAELYERQEKGEKVELVIRNKEERKRKYEKALEELRKEIDREVSLTVSMPKLIGAIMVKRGVEEEMVEDEEIERIGMELAMEYERRNGRKPEDISKENLGFDIRSRGKDGIRYIEVKARKDFGDVALTPNEWFKAKRFRNQYWLYVILNAAKKPEVYIINNPYENLEAFEKVEVVRFILDKKELLEKGEKVL